MLAVYLTPNVPSMLPDHNLFLSWAVDYDRLGLSPEEALARLNVGYLWHATSLFVYMIFVVGGNLVAAAYRWGNDAPHTPAGDEPETGGPNAKRSMFGRIVNFLSLGCSSILRPN